MMTGFAHGALPRTRLRLAAAALGSTLVLTVPALAQDGAARPQPTPVRQSALTRETAPPPAPLTLRDASRTDRWLGVPVSDVRWAPDGTAVYFRWNESPGPADDPAGDPWYRVDRAGRRVERVPDAEVHAVPAADPSWSADGRRAVWASTGALYVYDAGARGGATVRRVFAGAAPVRDPRIDAAGDVAYFMMGEDLYAYGIGTGEVRQLTRKHVRAPGRQTDAARWLEAQQLELFDAIRERRRREAEAERRRARQTVDAPQPIPVDEGVRIDDIRRSPDGRYYTFRWTRPDRRRPPTQYMDYVTASGYAEPHNARPKVGEPRDEVRLGIVRADAGAAPDSVEVVWASVAEAGDRPTIVHGPFWSVEGDRAVVEVLSLDHKDLWIGALDLETGRVTVIDHQHDDAWLGGPPPTAGRFQRGLLEWLPGGRLVFASERTGWSHLYLAEPDGRVRALTSGEWEVRDARLSRDRSRWLITASREHPADDHLYLMPAAGGELVRLTDKPGRHTGYLSPDGRRLAVVYSETIQLPDLYLRDPRPGAAEARITVSGTDNYYRHAWVRPEIVSFRHPDGGPLWAALFKPERQNPERAAVLHIHGGGYRQFAHRGWSVYGYHSHLGLINYLVQQGYTVLDFDYRGSAGYGRDYRTDIYRSMGIKDVDGAITAIDYLVREHGVDRSRIGVYGVSYGGFFTLMALFRHPGLFAAGVANAAVSDWAHYNDGFTSRILNLPYDDPEAYRVSSPIYYAEGLQDALLIVHGLIDDNVHFQDAARLVQRLIELEKDFEVMVYPTERHVINSEAGRFDFNRRVVELFRRHLLRPGAATEADARPDAR